MSLMISLRSDTVIKQTEAISKALYRTERKHRTPLGILLDRRTKHANCSEHQQVIDGLA